MKILFTCGGTAGHINPAIALARLFQSRHQDCQVLFAGADNGMERTLVPHEGYELRTVHVNTIHRAWKWKDIKHNVMTVVTLPQARRQARAILDEFKPDLVVGTGGYASYPVVKEAARRGIPTAVHESNAVPGLTTKLLSKVVDRVMVGFEDSRKHYPHPERVVVTGTPVRRDFFDHTRKEAREALGLADDRPLVLSYWGSLGADVMNRYMADFLQAEAAEGFPFHHIHGAGRNYKSLTAALAERGVELTGGAEVREYIYDMPLVMAAADLVVCRAGASTISELTAIAKPCVLVPSPNVTNNHQEKNARVLEHHGAAVVLLEPEIDGAALYREVKALLADPEKRAAMSKALTGLSVTDAAEEIYQTLMSLMKEGK
ncbi:undecaprenyldiphospho-muramoylpentapeptide beta-N-acetylglucosaminyltransferase [uncultured Intestinimonas sp.]|uniref:undecaprenyldiphospho-muramoylpentapeptide beta-N-acetylglucosaminyltransferase n=1 Tax=uncultured Intestinimonas sp. TaxID=1689265 RepID=UPI0025D7DBB6|nr:undecaprenyldiphospho-muramoylpentapeptide beta-N-acetylglucosaminyltransferase [uncultured Intestinimonas sp.]